MNYVSEITSRIRTFTSALTSVCEGRVRVVCDGRACTDGSTIYLPLPTHVISRQYADALCGIGCHEAAHIYYDSLPRFTSFIARFSANPALAADCFNAVLDVADETRFEKRFPLARVYFSATTTLAAVECVSALDGNLSTATDVLVIAILKVRRSRITDSYARRGVDALATHQTVAKCFQVLKRAVTRTKNGLPNRTAREWSKLEGLAEALIALCRHLPPGAASAGSTSSAVAPGVSAATEPSACQMGADGGGGVLADTFRGIAHDATDGHVRQGGAGDVAHQDHWRSRAFASKASLVDRHVKACFGRYAKLLLQSSRPVVSRPSQRGPRLGDVTRLYIDGKVFLRRALRTDTNAAIAVCLDCSGSMHDWLSAVAPLAASMAEALHEAGGNVGCWHFGDVSLRVSRRRMGFASCLGGTRTELAILEARRWLLAQPEQRKVLAIFTDGEPAYPEGCAQEVLTCKRYGIPILAGTLPDFSTEDLLSSMPGAELFRLRDNLAQSFHAAIRRIVRHSIQ